jgi:iron-sulfur cluster repair protein YtfE (RIC family)
MPWSADENDPIALLESDHRRFEDLLKQGEETTERAVKGRTALLDTLTAALNVHELIEEQVLYPALKPHAETREIVLEGFEEHHVADVIVKELHDLAKDNERWGAKFKVLQESLEHHIQEEERKMFPAARQVLSREELQDLGARMRAMKADADASITR